MLDSKSQIRKSSCDTQREGFSFTVAREHNESISNVIDMYLYMELYKTYIYKAILNFWIKAFSITVMHTMLLYCSTEIAGL